MTYLRAPFIAVLMFACSITGLAQEEILRSYVEGGMSAIQKGNYVEAERLFRAALSEIPETPIAQKRQSSYALVALNGLSLALMNQEKYASAESVTRKQIQLMELVEMPLPLILTYPPCDAYRARTLEQAGLLALLAALALGSFECCGVHASVLHRCLACTGGSG